MKLPPMKLPLYKPRLLPATIALLACVLVVKSVSLVRAASEHATAAPKETSSAAPKERTGQPAPEPMLPAASEPHGPPPPPPVSEAERTLLQELRSRRQELEARSAAIGAREATLAAVEERLNQRLAELQALQNKLEALDGERRKREDAGWEGLVKLYEAMKPRDAATIFNELDMPTLLQILDRMKEQKAAAIMAAMTTDRTREVTSQLAQLRQRRASVVGQATATPGRPNQVNKDSPR